jgi:hypothetical protein
MRACVRNQGEYYVVTLTRISCGLSTLEGELPITLRVANVGSPENSNEKLKQVQFACGR